MLAGMVPLSMIPASAALVDATVGVTQTGTSLSLRVDYGGTGTTIAAGDTIEIRMSVDASSIIRIVGFGDTTADIYGTVNGAAAVVGTRTYSYDGDVCILTIVFNSAYSDAGYFNVSGWYTANARLQYLVTTGETTTTMNIGINGEGMTPGPTITIPAGGPGTRPSEPDFVPGNKFGKIWRYGDTDGNGGGQITLDGDYTQFAEMRWFVNIGYSNLTNRDMRANHNAGISRGYWTTEHSLAYSSNNSTGAGYSSANEAYLDYQYWTGVWTPIPVNEPFHYDNVVFDDYLDIGPNYGTILCSPHDYIRDSIRIVRVIGREEGSPDGFREIADRNFLVAHDGRNINQIFRHYNQTIFNGRRGLTLQEFFTQMKSEGQFSGYSSWEDIITFDLVDNKGGSDPSNQVPHFRLELGDLHFSDSYTGTVTGVNRNNTTSAVIDNVPAKNLPYAYLVYYDTQATGAELDASGNYSYFNRAGLTYAGGNAITDFSPLWVKHEASGGGGTVASLRIKKVGETGVPIPGIEFTLFGPSPGGSQQTRNTNAAGDITFLFGAAGTYTLTETVPAGSGLIPIEPITFIVSSGEVDISGLLDDITYANGVNTIKNYYDRPSAGPEPASVTLQAVKTANAAMAAGQFDFSLYASDVSGVQGALLQTAANTAGMSGTVVFSEITYDEPGEFYYLLAETGGGGGGWSRDTAKYLIKVAVTEEDSVLLANVSYYSWDEDAWTECSDTGVTFRNTYTPDTPGSGNLPPDEPPPTNPPPDEPPQDEPPQDEPPQDEQPQDENRQNEPPQDERQEYIPGGNDFDMPPLPNTPGGALVPDGDGFLEFDDDGVPLGRWAWDEDEEMWMFEMFVPLSGMPRTGNNSSFDLNLILLGLSLISMVIMTKAIKVSRRQHTIKGK